MSASAPFVTQDRVRWADVDLIGIMRFSAYTRLVEMGEQELMRAAGIPYRSAFDAPAIWLPRRHLSIEYFAPVRIDEMLDLVTYVSRLGETSATINVDVRVTDGGNLAAAAAIVVVCVEPTTFAKRPLPAELRLALTPFVCSAPEARAGKATPPLLR